MSGTRLQPKEVCTGFFLMLNRLSHTWQLCCSFRLIGDSWYLKENILAVKCALKEYVDTVLHTIQADRFNLHQGFRRCSTLPPFYPEVSFNIILFFRCSELMSSECFYSVVPTKIWYKFSSPHACYMSHSFTENVKWNQQSSVINLAYRINVTTMPGSYIL